MSEYFQCAHIGTSTTEEVVFTEKPNALGGTFWEARQPITHLFGMEVQGCEVSGIGRTKEEALERMEADRTKLCDSLWA